MCQRLLCASTLLAHLMCPLTLHTRGFFTPGYTLRSPGALPEANQVRIPGCGAWASDFLNSPVILKHSED